MLSATFVNEGGYLARGPDAADALFHVVGELHFRRSMVFTTNEPLELWGRVLNDPDLAEAILGPLAEQSDQETAL